MELPEIVLLVIVIEAPEALVMAPPERLATLPTNVLLVIVAVPLFQIAPPASLGWLLILTPLFWKVVLLIVMVPILKIPPPCVLARL